MNIVTIIQARMGSTRLPGKALTDIAGEPMLARVVERVKCATTIDDVLVATTTEAADDAIAAFCAERGWKCSRGSENDVLDRYYQAAKATDADIVVRVTSDCPLIDHSVIDYVVTKFLQGQPNVDYASNGVSPCTFPRGLDTEVMHFRVLEKAWHEDHNPVLREHVTPYIYRNPEKFRLLSVINDTDLSSLRWTVDTPEDLRFIRLIYHHFGSNDFSWRETLQVLKSHPAWTEINHYIEQKSV